MTIDEALHYSDTGDRTLDDPLVVLADEIRAIRRGFNTFADKQRGKLQAEIGAKLMIELEQCIEAERKYNESINNPTLEK